MSASGSTAPTPAQEPASEQNEEPDDVSGETSTDTESQSTALEQETLPEDIGTAEESEPTAWSQQSAKAPLPQDAAGKRPTRSSSQRAGQQQSARSPSKENKKMSFEQRQEDLLEWGFWELEGRIGLTVTKDSYNGSLAWQQEGDNVDFRFRGPLGFGGVRIHGVLGEQVRVKTTRGEEFILKDVEVEMQEQMGWSLPINSLRYWTLGIADPELDAEVVLNENDLLDELVQGEWSVIYDSYQDVDGVGLPRKLNVTGPNTKIRLIVNEWTIPAAE